MRRLSFSIVGVLAVLAIAIGINLFADARLANMHIDLTKGGLYTLSTGTRQILSGLKEPITLRLFYSRRLGSTIPVYGTFADQVREIGKNPELQNETVRQLMASREARQPDLEGERQRLQTKMLSRQAEAKRLLAAVGEGRRDGSLVGDRLTELDAEIATLERRMTAVRQELLALEAEHVEADDLCRALSMFDPVWDQLTPQEQARVTGLLIESVAYNGPAGTDAITFRPLGIRTLSQGAADDVRGPKKTLEANAK